MPFDLRVKEERVTSMTRQTIKKKSENFGIFAKGFLNIFIVIVDIASFKSKERDNGSLRAQSTECKLKKDWLEVNYD